MESFPSCKSVEISSIKYKKIGEKCYYFLKIIIYTWKFLDNNNNGIVRIKLIINIEIIHMIIIYRV